jgi:hypothetical protein
MKGQLATGMHHKLRKFDDVDSFCRMVFFTKKLLKIHCKGIQAYFEIAMEKKRKVVEKQREEVGE